MTRKSKSAQTIQDLLKAAAFYNGVGTAAAVSSASETANVDRGDGSAKHIADTAIEDTFARFDQTLADLAKRE